MSDLEVTRSKRDTRQRLAIRKAFQDHGRPLSPREVLKIAAHRVPNLGIATVYRNIKAMLDQGELESVDIPGQAARYQLPHHRKKHLFICSKTDRVFTFDFDIQGVNISLPECLEVKDVQLVCYGESSNGTDGRPVGLTRPQFDPPRRK